MNATLKAYLVEKHGLAADADEAAVKAMAKSLIASGKLDVDQYAKLCAPAPAAGASKLDQLADLLKQRGLIPSIATIDATAQRAAALGGDGATAGASSSLADSPVQAADVFGPVAKALANGGGNGNGTGRVDVAAAGKRYDATPGRLKTWHSDDPRRAFAMGPRFGQPITLPGASAGKEIREQSQLQKARAGAFFAHNFAVGMGVGHMLSDHIKQLARECYEEELFVGDVWDADRGEMVYLRRPSKLTPGQKAGLIGGNTLPLVTKDGIIANSTTGGTYLVPYYFDVDVVTYPLLANQLFPLVDLQEVEGTNQVIRGQMNNLTINEGPAEGDQNTAITLETVSGPIISQLVFNIYPATGGILIGRDFLSDSPVNVQALVYELYKMRLANWLDKEIAIGAGTIGPLGLMNTSSPKTYTFTNGSAGPLLVKDLPSMLSTLPKQYRDNNPRVAWVSNDTFYFLVRHITVNGTTDQRLIFGYDVEKYTLFNRPWLIQNDMTNVQSAFVDLSRYQMWRRLGLQFEITTDGKNLMLANEALVVIRSRWSGKMVDPNAVVVASNSPKT